MKNILLVLMIAILTLTACAPAVDESVTNVETSTPQKDNSPYLPSPDDAKFIRSEVMLESTNLLTLESFPLQFTLQLVGSLSTPCHLLRVATSKPDKDNKIALDVYSVVDPGLTCIQVIEPFEVNIPLGSFPTGHYTLWVNGKQIAEFDS